jgi:hypothetical protein
VNEVENETAVVKKLTENARVSLELILYFVNNGKNKELQSFKIDK